MLKSFVKGGRLASALGLAGMYLGVMSVQKDMKFETRCDKVKFGNWKMC